MRTRYRRQQYVLHIEYLKDYSTWPMRETLPVRDMKQARAEMVRFAFVMDIVPSRVWVAKYVYGNTTHVEQEIALTMWAGRSYNVGMPGWCYRETFLVGCDKP